ncbi:hypothetical protein [Aurantimicrobium minutum]|uniref:hypothetical protein n=1 Tax=Aurantimicrobium minutum TaxID=708131 RepID=UPI002472E8F1|nr:hypothetical protein [Aurantimicrobium minutum]MDH6423197.1 hypothetical protein [Aurantimicrobium minutum]
MKPLLSFSLIALLLTALTACTQHGEAKPAASSVDEALSNYAEVAPTAYASMDAAEEPVLQGIEIDFDFQDGVSEEMRGYITENVGYSVAHLGALLGTPEIVHVVGMSTRDWGKEHITGIYPNDGVLSDDMNNMLADGSQWGKATAPCRGMGGFAIGYTENPIIVLDAGTGCTWVDPQEEAAGIDVASDVVSHEFFHLGQTALSGTDNISCVAPTWFSEGQAVVVGIHSSRMDSQSRSAQTRNATLNWLEKASSSSMKQLEKPDYDKMQEYRQGALAVEYLVARSGWKKSLELISEAGRLAGGQCLSDQDLIDGFNTAFLTVYGQSLDQFYAEVTPYLEWSFENKQPAL